MKILKKILKYVIILLSLAFVVLYIIFYRFSTPKSDSKIIASFTEKNYTPKIHYLDFDNRSIRVLMSKEKIDPSLPTLLFIHGSIGSSMDFERYLTDDDLNKKANLISYDRIGYGQHQKGAVLNSIAKETDLVHTIIQEFNLKNVILLGYSFGGPIALNYSVNYPLEKLVLCAPAIYGEHEKVPGMINFYKWRLTRFLVPNVWKSASKEKLSHVADLMKFENKWHLTQSKKIIGIHGDADWIVPFENSTTLQKVLPEDKFSLITIKDESHGLVWNSYYLIKRQLMQLL